MTKSVIPEMCSGYGRAAAHETQLAPRVTHPSERPSPMTQWVDSSYWRPPDIWDYSWANCLITVAG
jgi:hypothetical protein